MNMKLIAASIAGILLSATAVANPIVVSHVDLSASTEVILGDGTTESDLDTGNTTSNGPGFSVDSESLGSPLIFDGEIISHYAYASAQDNGVFATDVFIQDVGNVAASLRQLYTVKNTSSLTQAVTFDFRVEEGNLLTQCSSGFDGEINVQGPEVALLTSAPSCADFDQQASYVAELLVGSNQLFYSRTQLSANDGVQEATFQEGVSLATDSDLFDGFFEWDTQIFTGVSLGILAPGEEVTLSYNVDLNANIAPNDSTIESIFDFGFTGLSLNGGVILSDPFNFKGQPFIASNFVGTPVNTPVPTPGILSLFGLGILLLASRKIANH